MMLPTIEPANKQDIDDLVIEITERLGEHLDARGQIATFACDKLGPNNVVALVVSLLRDMPQGYLETPNTPNTADSLTPTV